MGYFGSAYGNNFNTSGSLGSWSGASRQLSPMYEAMKAQGAATTGQFYGGGLYNPMSGRFQSPSSMSTGQGQNFTTASGGPSTWGANAPKPASDASGFGLFNSFAGGGSSGMFNPLAMMGGLVQAPGQQTNPAAPYQFLTSLLARMSQPPSNSGPSLSITPRQAASNEFYGF
jgi:hypothetical protein